MSAVKGDAREAGREQLRQHCGTIGMRESRFIADATAPS
jgi:hypothetical protein